MPSRSQSSAAILTLDMHAARFIYGHDASFPRLKLGPSPTLSCSIISLHMDKCLSVRGSMSISPTLWLLVIDIIMSFFSISSAMRTVKIDLGEDLLNWSIPFWNIQSPEIRPDPYS